MSNKKRVVDLNGVSDESAKFGQLPAFKDSPRPMRKSLVDLTVDCEEVMRVSSPLSKNAWSPASASKSAHSTHREPKDKRRVSKSESKYRSSLGIRPRSKDRQDLVNNTTEGQPSPNFAAIENGPGVNANSTSPKPIPHSTFEDIPNPPGISVTPARSIVRGKSRDLTHQDPQKTPSKKVETEQSISSKDIAQDESQEEQEDLDLPPLSLEVFQGILRKTLAKLRETHQALVQSNLNVARQSCNATSPGQYTQMGSPFVNMRSLNSDASITANSPRKRGRLDQSIAKTMKPNIEKLSVPFVTCSATKILIPPYTNYISSKRNIIIEDDKQRAFLPYHGDDAWVDSDYADLESTIGRNRSNYHRLNAVDEQAKRYDPYVDDFLKQMGSDIRHILLYLLDESNPAVPSDLPKELAPIWLNRESHIQEDYYEDSEDSDATDSRKKNFARPKKPKMQWQAVLNSIAKPPQSGKLAAAGLACKAFMNVANFSLWHVVKRHRLVSQAIGGKFKFDDYTDTTPASHDDSRGNLKETNQIDTYTDLGCLVCFAHECPGHGEFNDEEDQKNIRTRINAKPLSPVAADKRLVNGSDKLGHRNIDASVIRNALGMNEDKSVSGQALITINGTDCAYQDDEVCSNACFWLKSNRLRAVSEFTDEETESLHTFLPAYYQNRRGPCMLALAIDKPCVEIFLKLLQIPTADIPIRVKARNQEAGLMYRSAPKRTGDYWYLNSITWKHHERPPFRPCNHEGPCSAEKNCTCFDEEVLCEKTCMCSGNCARRYQGCSCAARGKICWGNDKCDCYRLHRECDPDLCRNCGAQEVLDPANRYREDIAAKKCTNVYLQRGIPRRTLLGHSKLLASGGMTGWGLYMGEPLKNGDYIGEYVGEVVSRDEGERRGLIYDKRNMSYLFDLNDTQTLDSTSVGNKFRYINHQADPHANCRAKILFCNTIHRIGMFACQNIEIGDELLFDYGENFTSRFNLIKLDENSQPTIEKRRVGITKTKSTTDDKVLVKKPEVNIGKPRKNVTMTKPAVILQLPPGMEGIESLGAGLGSDIQIVQTSNVSRKRRRSTLNRNLDGPADEPMEEVEMWDLSSSESYHESAEEEEEEEEVEVGQVEEEEEDEEEEDEEEVEEEEEDEDSAISGATNSDQPSAQKRGWVTRYANMAKRQGKAPPGLKVEEVYETPQKRGWKTRYARMARIQAEQEKERKRNGKR